MSHLDRSDCRATLELLEAYVDGELTGATRAVLERHVARCPSCAGELALARRVRSGLRSLPELRCPDRVVAAAREGAERGRWWSPAHRWPAARRPVLVLGAMAAAVLIAIVLSHWPERRVEHSAVEIARADAEIRVALSYVARMNRRAGSTLRMNAMEPALELPLTLTVKRLGGSSHRATEGGRPCA